MMKRDLNLFLLAAVIGGVLITLQPASAQLTLPGGATFDLFGPPGLATDRNVVLQAKQGPFNTIYGNFALPAGASLDWHVNPGVAIITATKGIFNEHRSDGCVSLHEAGDVFFEREGEVHKITNPGTETAEALITFIVPVGSELVTFVPPPAEKPCVPGDSHGGGKERFNDLEEIKAAVEANAAAIAESQTLLARVARALSLKP